MSPEYFDYGNLIIQKAYYGGYRSRLGTTCSLQVVTQSTFQINQINPLFHIHNLVVFIVLLLGIIYSLSFSNEVDLTVQLYMSTV